MLLERGHPVRIERKARQVADQSSAMLHEPMRINKIFLVLGSVPILRAVGGHPARIKRAA